MIGLPPRAEWRRLYRHWVRDPAIGARLHAGHQALRLLPTETAFALGGRLGQLTGRYLHPPVNQRIRAALGALRPDLFSDPVALDAAAPRVWNSLGRAYAEFSAEHRLWAEGRVTVQGAEHLHATREPPPQAAASASCPHPPPRAPNSSVPCAPAKPS